MSSPKILLRLEGTAVLIAACIAYQQVHGSWLLFAVLLLSPDLFMLGYLLNPKIGAAAYNLVHTYIGPILLLCIVWIANSPSALPFVLIWLAHVGMDRMFGYGLKYPTAFKDTHFCRV
jgi:hypothetical protein